MKKKYPKIALLFSFIVLLPSCWDSGNDLPKETLILNEWIWEGMNEIYLWEAEIPTLDPDLEHDPESFFYKLLYSEDKYSWIVDDYDALLAMFDGVQQSTGMSLSPVKYTDYDVVSFVEYITPGSPAEAAGIKRGDIVYTIDGVYLTPANYFELTSRELATWGFADWENDCFVCNDIDIRLQAIELNQNPVVYHTIINYENLKVGYFVYTQFTSGSDGEWLDELNAVLEEFKTAAVDDVIIDLRYNPGGSLYLSSYLAGSLVPLAVMEKEEVFTDLVWNDMYTDYWLEEDLDEDGRPDGEESMQLRVRLPRSDFNLDLDRVYILTTRGTASASESLITGLEPYMDVFQVGDTSYGKCYASVTIDDWADPKRHNWAMQPIVIKYANAAGLTDFTGGLTPDMQLRDNLLYAKPFGSLEDPLMAAALEHMSGVNTEALKAAPGYSDEGFQKLPVELKNIPEWKIDLPELK